VNKVITTAVKATWLSIIKVPRAVTLTSPRLELTGRRKIRGAGRVGTRDNSSIGSVAPDQQ
jgi:hypothetical protein